MKLILNLNKYTATVILFLLSVLSRLMGISWIYQLMYFIFTVPDYSVQGFLLNISMIIILSFLIILMGITKVIIILKNRV
ncbi:hypothetical protein D1867_03155 [Acidianus infernus]|uniref:Uncharacterized protein n=1 Tax=Acidianus infernus TaxID=12915 RepID=A0A6A9QGC3_ACIIN|nr:hypothetical protein [Acidianus infernus]MUM64266.1 hypothetical protein [Acidianus infernus]